MSKLPQPRGLCSRVSSTLLSCGRYSVVTSLPHTPGQHWHADLGEGSDSRQRLRLRALLAMSNKTATLMCGLSAELTAAVQTRSSRPTTTQTASMFTYHRWAS